MRLLLSAGLMAPVVYTAGFLVAIEPGYNPWTDYVSDLSLGPDGWMQVNSFIVCGWLELGFSAALCELAERRLAPAWSRSAPRPPAGGLGCLSPPRIGLGGGLHSAAPAHPIGESS